MSETGNTITTTTTDTPKLTPEALIEQLRNLQSQVEEVTPLSAAERTQLRQVTRRQPPHVVQASISVIGSSGTIADAVGQPIDQVVQMQTDASRWALAADELRIFLKGIEGANLVRQQKLAFIASQAYSIGTQLARSPQNAKLVPQVEEIKRLKVQARRKKAQPESPQPQPPSKA
ncbi:MAG TPA: hypothetical protein VGJ82_17185 [Thermoanaerobaculia bacterium]|jgi:hypothetical protein